MHVSTIRCLLASVLLSGLMSCGGLPVDRTEFGPGKILLLPPRDVVQAGEAHEKGEGLGQRLQDQLESRIGRYDNWATTKPDGDAFDHRSIADRGQAVDAAKHAGSDYVLQVVLGEFRNAAPMTFRTDLVTLEAAVMWRAESGEELWRLRKPVRYSEGNFSSHLGLVDGAAKAIAAPICRSSSSCSDSVSNAA